MRHRGISRGASSNFTGLSCVFDEKPTSLMPEINKTRKQQLIILAGIILALVIAAVIYLEVIRPEETSGILPGVSGRRTTMSSSLLL